MESSAITACAPDVDVDDRASSTRPRRIVRFPRGALLASLLVVPACLALRIQAAPAALSLSVLIGLVLAGMALDGRPLARFGLRFPPAVRDAQALTLVSPVLGFSFAYAAVEMGAYIGAGRVLVPNDDVRLDLMPFYLGYYLLWAAIPEELLFRGFLAVRVRAALGGGLRAPRRFLLGGLIVSALFVAAHAPLHGEVRPLIGVILLAPLVGWLRDRTGSLVAPIVCHTLFDATLNWISVTHR
jgi:membrane protease YdiL (CAAX protease family)